MVIQHIIIIHLMGASAPWCTSLQLGRGTPSCNHNNGPAKWGSAVARRVLCSYAICCRAQWRPRVAAPKEPDGFPIRQRLPMRGTTCFSSHERAQQATGPVCLPGQKRKDKDDDDGKKQIRYENQPSATKECGYASAQQGPLQTQPSHSQVCTPQGFSPGFTRFPPPSPSS